MAGLAIEAAQRGPAVPIPLTNNTTRVVGVVYDQYLLGVSIARAQMAAGKTPDAQAVMADPLWQSRGTVVVAYPIDCEGRPNQPLAIRWTTTMNVPVQPAIIAGPMLGKVQTLLPGVAVPDGAMVVSIRNAVMVNATVAVDYMSPACGGAAKTALLPVITAPSGAAARGINGIKIPSQLSSLPSPSTVRVSMLLDAAGHARFPEQVQGPPELGALAIADLTSKTYPPSTINGVPMPMSLTVPYVYTTTGESGQVAPYTPVTPSGALVVSATSTAPAARPGAPVPPPLPPVPPGLLDAQLARIAAEVGAKSDPVPVPLDAAGPAVHGVLFDRFLVGAVRARAALKAGTPIDPANAPAALVQNDFVAVAFPVTCNGVSVAPSEIAVARAGTQAGLRQTGTLTRETLSELLPGVVFPTGAVARTFAGGAFSLNLEVRVTYSAPPCGSGTPTLSFPIQWARGQSNPHLSVAKLPAGSALPSPTQVQVRGMVDLAGAYRFPSLADGPPELADATSAAAAPWTFQVYRANGVPSPISVVTTLTFTTTGLPEPLAAPSGVTPPVATPAEAPPLLTSSTVSGRSTTDFTTADVTGLTPTTSKCEVASDATYGFSAGNAIKVGGSFSEGPKRARAYLATLRGPAGQGLHVVRLGATIGPDKETILDLYELSFSGAPKPARVYVDQYHEAPLKAPTGFTCAAAGLR